MQYRQEIDGLRALAVLPVILFHAEIWPFTGGFVGVDVFFVISGYLITGILLEEKQKKAYSLVGFYERRARRILPALFCTLVFCLPFAWMWLLPDDLKAFARSLIAVSLFGSNLLFWKTTSYFDHSVDLKPLLHTWSLAVEEQFYLLFPLVLGLLSRGSRFFLRGGLLLLFLISLGYAEYLVQKDPTAAFYLLPSRAFELLLGALIAEVLRSNSLDAVFPEKVLEGLGMLGLVLILASIFLFDRNTPFPGVAALLPTFGTGLVLVFSSGNRLSARFLQLRLLRGIGLISYSAYLLHQPLFAFARHRLPWALSTEFFAGLSLMTLVLASISWRFVEKPLRDTSACSRKAIFSMALIGSGFFILLGAGLLVGRGFPERLPVSARLGEIEYPKRQAGWCFHDVWTTTSLTVGLEGTSCWLGDRKAAYRAVLVGDSFAGQYEPVWDTLGRHYGIAVNAITTNWCYPTLSNDFPSRLSPRALEQCLFNRSYVAGHLEDYDLLILAGDWGTESKKSSAMKGLWDLIERAESLGKPVIVMGSPRQFDTDVMRAYRKSQLLGLSFDISKAPSQRDANMLEAHRLIAEKVMKFHHVIYLPREMLFRRLGEPSDLDADGVPFSLEGEHISVRGARAVALNLLQNPIFDAQLVRLLKTSDQVKSK